MIETNWCIITGSPGAGKTTIINKLSQMGYTTFPEVTRPYIEGQLKKGKTLEQLRKNQKEFDEEILRIRIELEKNLPQDKLVFLDRSILDSIAFQKLYLDIKEYDKSVCPYKYKKVFFIEMLPNYPKNDPIRREDIESSKKVGELLIETYKEFGMDVIRIPFGSVEERIKLILSCL